jgi:fumarylpyruvate hydrolase
MTFAIEFPTTPAIPIAGSQELFPVRRIWCIGRNYAEHALEMGSDPVREPPFFFSKPADAIVPGGGILPFPKATAHLEHEVELAVAIGSPGGDINPSNALRHVFAYAVALDMTRRDLQTDAKRNGRPWEMGKAFDQSCPISSLHRVSDIGHPESGYIALSVNGAVRQSGDIRQRIWSTAECIASLSQFVTLAAGDIILTGTPAGVGPIFPGDRLRAVLSDFATLDVRYLA